MRLEKVLEQELGLHNVRSTRVYGGGCINEGAKFESDEEPVYVKSNDDLGSLEMFEGEFASLAAIHAIGAVRCPKPLKCVDLAAHGAILVTEYLDLHHRRPPGFMMEFGAQLAKMHVAVARKRSSSSSFVGAASDVAEPQFGFDTTTCCGRLPLDNSYKADWAEFFVQNRLRPQIDRILRTTGDRDLNSAQVELYAACDTIFANYENPTPSLLHGDLWSGNYAVGPENEPVIYDPASFYGDAEFEQGIMNMFGGFNDEFWSGYHSILPRKEGRDLRVQLYTLFHELNHWNHFGSGYKPCAMSSIRDVLRRAL